MKTKKYIKVVVDIQENMRSKRTLIA